MSFRKIKKNIPVKNIPVSTYPEEGRVINRQNHLHNISLCCIIKV